MTKDELMKLAEAGVREELRAMQVRLNELAKEFPHIVGNQDGTVPAVLPVVLKGGAKPRGAMIDLARAFLMEHPGASTVEIAEHLGTAASYVVHLMNKIGAKRLTKHKRGSTVPITWKL
jgi:hypothetical protein